MTDLQSIVAGVVVSAIVLSAAAVTGLGLIPASRDNEAKDQLKTVSTAQASAQLASNRFYSADELANEGLMDRRKGVFTLTGDTGSCYVTAARSGTGTIFYVTNENQEPQELEDLTATGCDGVTAQDLTTKMDAVEAEESSLPAVPSISKQEHLSGLKAKFIWGAIDAKDQGAVYYEAQMKTGEDDWADVGGEIKGTSITVDGQYGLDVYVRVRAVSSNGASDYSVEQSVEIPPLPAAGAVAVTGTTGSTVSFDWNGAGGLTYTVEYRINGRVWQSKSSGQEATEATIEGKPGDRIELRVRATNKSGSAEYASAEGTVATEAEANSAPVATGKVSSSNNLIAAFSWTSIPGVDTYTIEYGIRGGTKNTTTHKGTSWSAPETAENQIMEVRVSADGGTTYSNMAAVKLSGIEAPATPTNLEALPTEGSNTSADLSWTGSDAATSYTVQYRKSRNDSWKTKSTNKTLLSVDELVAASTLTWQVQAKNAGGESDWSSLETLILAQVPDKPVVSVDLLNDNKSGLFNWDETERTDSYLIEYQIDGGDWRELVPEPPRTLQIIEAEHGQTITARVVAVNKLGSTTSEQISLKLPALPAAPTKVSAIIINGTQATFDWADVEGAESYVVQKRINGGAWTGQGLADAAQSDALITAPTVGDLIEVRVKSRNDIGDSANWSAVASAPLPSIPAAPELTGKLAKANTARFVWNAPTGTESYLIERQVEGGWTTVKRDHTGTTIDVESDLGTELVVRVSAVNKAGQSAGSNQITITMGIIPDAPVLESKFTDADHVVFSWNTVPGADDYTVQHLVGPVWTNYATPAGATSVTITGIGGASESFRVRATNANGASAWSSTAQITFPVPPKTPVVTGVADGTAAAIFTWGAVPTAESYRVEYRDGTGPWQVLSSNQSRTTVAVSSRPGSSVSVRVSATNVAGTSGLSAVSTVSMASLPTAPAITSRALSGTEARFYWTTETGITGYWVEASINDGAWTLVSADQAETGATITGVADDVIKLRIKARNSVGTSSNWSESSAVSLPLPPARPTLSGVVVDGLTASFSWKDVARADSYTLTYTIDGGRPITVLNHQNVLAWQITVQPSQTVEATLIAHGVGGDSPTSVALVTVDSLAAAPVVSGAARTGTIARFTWAGVPDADTYYTECKINDGPWQYRWTHVQQNTGPVVDCPDAANGETISFRAQSRNSAGLSEFSNVASVTLPTVPKAPALTGSGDGTIVHYTWTSENGVDSYKVEYRTNAGAWTILSAAQKGTSTTISATYGDVVEARVTAVNLAGTATSNVASVGIPHRPGIVHNVRGTAISGTKARFDWDPVPGATSYLIERLTKSGAWVTHTPANTAGHQYVDAVTAGEVISIRIKAKNVIAYSSGWSNVGTVDLPEKPAAPVVTGKANALNVTFTWPAVPGAESYRVETIVGTGSSVQTVTTNTISVIGTPGQKVSASLVATNLAGDSPVSNAASVTIQKLPGATTLTGTAMSGTDVAYKWTKATDATRYETNYQVKGGSWTGWKDQGDSLQQTVTSPDRKAVSMMVRGCNAVGCGPEATSGSITLIDPPATVTEVRGKFLSGTEVEFSWDAVEGADDYLLREIRGGPWIPVPYQNGNKLSYRMSGEPGEKIGFLVYTQNEAGILRREDGNYAYKHLYVTLPVKPAAVTIDSEILSGTQARFTWNDVPGETGNKTHYRINGGSWDNGQYPTNNTQTVTASEGDVITFRVYATNLAGFGPLTDVTVTLPTKPAKAVLRGSPAAGLSANYDWNEIDGATRYEYTYQVGSGAWSGWTNGGTSLSRTIRGAEGQEVELAVRACNLAGCGTQSPTITVTLPQTPSRPVVTGVVDSGTEATFTWPFANGAKGYRVESSTNGGSTWKLVNAHQSTHSTVVTGANGQVVAVRVMANNLDLSSPWSATAKVTLPVKLVMGEVNGNQINATQATYTWDPVPGATGYAVKSKVDGGSYTSVTVLPASAKGFTATGVGGHKLTAAVYPINLAGTGAYSLKTIDMLTAPATPTNIKGEQIDATTARFTWTATSTATYYKVNYRIGYGSDWNDLETENTDREVTVSAQPGESTLVWYYACNVAGCSPSYDISRVNLLAAPTTPAVTATVSGSTVKTSWTATGGGLSYEVQYQKNGGAWTRYTPYASGTTDRYVTVSGVVGTGDKVRIRVVALNEFKRSSWGYSDTEQIELATPTGITAVAKSDSKIEVTWNAVPNARSYKVYKSVDGASNDYVESPYGTSTTLTGFSTGQKVRIVVVAYSSNTGDSGNGYSNTITMPQPPSPLPTPTGLSASGTNGGIAAVGYAQLSWAQPSSGLNTYEVGYIKVNRFGGESGGWSTADNSPVKGGYSTSTSIPCQGTYKLRVRWVDSTLGGPHSPSSWAYSNQVSVHFEGGSNCGGGGGGGGIN